MRLQRWGNVRTEGLTQVAEASVESRITQTGAVGPVAVPVIGTITLFITLLPIEALRTACTQETTHIRLQITTSCCGKGNISLKLLKLLPGTTGGDSPSWHTSPLTPGGQRQLPPTGSQLAPFLHLQGKEQFLPKYPSGQAVRIIKRVHYC